MRLTRKLIKRLLQELEVRRKQFEFYREKLLSFDKNDKQMKLEELCSVARGKVISKNDIQDNPGDYPVYSSQTENNGELGRINTYMYEGEYLTWTTDGANAGTVFYRNGKFNITNVCGILQSNEELVDIRYLYHFLTVAAPKYVSKGMGNPKLMSNVMKSIKVFVPPLSEQKRIADILERYNTACLGLISRISEEVSSRKSQYSFYRDKLLSFKEI